MKSALGKRQRVDVVFSWIGRFATAFCLLILLALLFHLVQIGVSWLSWDFLQNFPSRFPEKAGIKSALYGTFWLMGLTFLIAVPVGVGAAIFLQEYMKESKIKYWLQLNIKNLAGMPSVVYGLLGLMVFVRWGQFGNSLLSGALTISLLIMPVIIIASQEAIKAVPSTLKEAAYGLGARRWQVVFFQVVPAALPGIMTGVILAFSRAIGESAPLIIIGALSYIAFLPEGPLDDFTVLPVQIYNWASRPQLDFHSLAAAAILVLLVVLFFLNFVAVVIRKKFQKYTI